MTTRIFFAVVLMFSTPAASMATGCTAGAHTFCVTNAGDDSVDPAPAAGTGTLRQAIIDANAAGGADVIGFNIAGSGPFTISLLRQLPAINTGNSITSLTIDGYSQPGSVMNTHLPDEGGLTTQLMIEVVGNGSMPGFFYNCCAAPKINLTLQGLALHGFSSVIIGQSNGPTTKAKLTVYGCFIGTKIDGTALATQGNSAAAVNVGYDDAQIGGTQAWQRNLLSGNGGSAVFAGGSAATVVVEGNLIGTDATGTTAIPNGISTNQPGLWLQGDQAGFRIGCSGGGCSSAASRNVISGNLTYGVGIWDSYGQNTGSMQFKGNFIGTDWTGTQPLPNGQAPSGCPTYCGGIQLQGGSVKPSSVIGGFASGEANLIAYNKGPGITGYSDAIGASFDNQGNAIHNNASVDVGFNLATWFANDADDADTGTNKRQNWPVIESASVVGGNLDVTYHVDSAVDSTVDSTGTGSKYPLRVDFYVDVDDGSGEWLVNDSYPSTSAQVSRSVSLALPPNALPLVGFVAAATDANGYSSEYSPSFVFDRLFANGFNH